ncbi:unnamed protein product [Vitrella brassicaformis CCMP3155]|uniref:Uncharacterized protein n=1 Tax=Vitrella brassicaformis (strain CCMP3155) TaxID=1169540 RepID=A0A0G4FST2_VITBC|nr:unnamed protein product [Vitrella brassicaformis CCMP3155]|eukprot:CEM17501.1 unnamed protein product [Vitrella brassicaformis CCMP3155]
MEAAWVRQIGSQTPDCIRSEVRQRVRDLLQMVDELPFGHLDSDVYDGIRDRIDRIIELIDGCEDQSDYFALVHKKSLEAVVEEAGFTVPKTAPTLTSTQQTATTQSAASVDDDMQLSVDDAPADADMED